MERLTRKDSKGWYINDQSVAYDERRRGKKIDLLAAYEDTGLTPEEVAELAQAKTDERLLVVPRKVGDTVWAIISPTNDFGLDLDKGQPEIFECTIGSISLYPAVGALFRLNHCGESIPLFFNYTDFGKTVFLTREEAEAALTKRG